MRTDPVYYLDLAERHRRAAAAERDAGEAAQHSYLAERYETLARLYRQMQQGRGAGPRGRLR